MLNSTDKFLVNDGSVTETVNWSDIQSEAFPMTVSVVLTPDEPEVNEEVTATPVTTGGDAPYTYTYQWVTADNALGLNQTDIVGATANTYTPVSADKNKFLGCVAVSTDDAGNTSTGTGYATTAVELALVIAKPTILTPEDGAGIGGDITYNPETSAITAVEDTQPIVGIAQDSLLAAYEAGEIEFDAQAQINAQITVKNQLDAAGVTAITGFWLGYPGSTHAAYGVRAYSAYLMRFDLTGNGWSAAAGDIRDRTTLDRVVGEAYYSNDYAFEPWWNKTPDKNPQGQPPGGAAMTGSAVPGEVYGSFFSNPITRTIGSDADLDFRVGTYIDANLATDVEKVNSAAAIGIYDQDENLVVLFGYDAGNINTVLTLTDNKAFNSDTGDEVTTIDQVFKAGDKVVGNGDATVFADSLAFSTTLYTGNQSVRTIETGIDSENKSLVWIKNRTEANQNHYLFDTERGAGNYMFSNRTTQQQTNTGMLSAFKNNGFDLGIEIPTNSSGKNYVAWNFRAAPGFMDIVTYVGTGGQAGNFQTVKHNLGVDPGFIITKGTEQSTNWFVYTFGLQNIALNLDNNFQGVTNNDIWGNTSPTETEFTVGGSNNQAFEYVAYVFASNPNNGIEVGAYYGDGSSPQAIPVQFKPGWVLVKDVTAAGDWLIIDSKRLNDDGTTSSELYPNEDYAEFRGNTHRLTDSGFTAEGPYNKAGSYYTFIAISDDASAGQFLPTGVLTADAAGTSMTLTDVTGEWKAGLTAVNETEVTELAPGADEIVFTSSKPAITSGSVVSWGAAEWELSVDSGFVDKQTSSVFLADSNPELGPTNFTLEDDTEYWVRTKYNSADPVVASEWSDSTKFKTAGGSSGAYGNFSSTLYTGNNASPHSIETGIDNTNESLIWIKSRSNDKSHQLVDSLRYSGSSYLALSSDKATEQEVQDQGVLSFDSNGFTVGSGASVNGPSYENVAWNFAAAPGFFDVVTYDGDDTAQTHPHSLGIKPGCMIIKAYDSIPSGSPVATSWAVYHTSLGATQALLLNSNSQATASTGTWNDTEPTDTEFTVGRSTNTGKPNTHVAYLFADNPDGGIKCGTGNGAPATIDCGFKPGWVLLKRSSGVSSWYIFDSKRGNMSLSANVNSPEQGPNDFTFTDTGFTQNVMSDDFIYVAIADTTVLFYDEAAGKTVTNHTLTKRYGVDPLTTDLKKYDIYPLTEQPTYAAAAYVRENGHYRPIRSYLSEVNRANQTISDMQAAFETRIAALESEE